MLKINLCFILICFTYLIGSAQNNLTAFNLDAYINKGLADWKVPGLAVVIIKDGNIVVQKGYGVKNIETKETVDAQTLFFIASNSKLFTGTALANLEVEKKLNLNDKITKYYPNYKLYNQTMTDMVTIKDMLTHRIGTKTFQGDFTFWNTKLSREEIMNRMRFLKPVNEMRDAYGYCNSCFLTAGMIIPKVTGKSWEDYITQQIITPLQMTATSAISNGIEKRVTNIATPYTTSFTNQLKQVPFDIWDNLGPAASVVSNVTDLTNWLKFQLDSGKFNGTQVMPWVTLQKTRDVQIVTGSRKSSVYPMHFRGYGLGVFTADYNGKQIYWHTGGAAGMVSNVCFVPEENLGIAILTNNDNQNFFEALRYQILDAYLGVDYTDRSAAILPRFNSEMSEQIKETEKWQADVIRLNNKELSKYIGVYEHPLYGSINIGIAKTGGELTIKFNTHPDLTAQLQKMNSGDWLLTYSNIEYGIFKSAFSVQEMKINKSNTKVIKVSSIIIKTNDFVEYDAYEFIKKK